METYLEDTNGVLCFKHAVEKAVAGAGDIRLKVYDDDDCGQSGCWWLGGCYECDQDKKAKTELQ